MGKAIMSNKIYMTYSKELYIKLQKELTYQFEGRTPESPMETISTLTTIGQKVLLIPNGREDLIPKDFERVEKRCIVDADIPSPKFTLRPSQQKFVDMIIDDEVTTAICNAKPGFGKSFTALGLAYKLQIKTLIVVHTLKLREQWRDDIKKQFGFEAGIIGSGEFNIAPPIVVANVQTLSKHAGKYSTTFGLLVLDEAHKTPSTTFTNVIASSKAMYKIGLTATIARRDLKQILTLDYFGKNNIYKPPTENTMEPKIILYPSEHKIPGNQYVPWAVRINRLTEQASYQAEIVNLVSALVTRRRKILIVSDRVEFLENCSAVTPKSVCITGETLEQDEKQYSIKMGENFALYGSINIYKEGISLNYLDTLVLANPIASEPLLEQVVGRIMRMYEGKSQPEVYDICLKGDTARRQLNTRMTFYMREGFEIFEFK